MERAMDEALKPGERIGMPEKLTDEQIAALIWPMRYQVIGRSEGTTHIRIEDQA